MIFAPLQRALQRWAIAQDSAGSNSPTLTTGSKAPESSFYTKKLNNVWHADAWCSTPDTYDETCINNAIRDIALHGPVGQGGHKFGTIVVGSRSYSFNTSVVFPEGLDINLVGVDSNNLFGTIYTSTVKGLTLFQDSADSISIRNATLYSNGIGQTGISLGTTKSGPFTIASIVAQNPATISGTTKYTSLLLNLNETPTLTLGQMVTIAGNSVGAYNSAFGYVERISRRTVTVQLVEFLAASGTGTGGTVRGNAQTAFDSRLTNLWFQSQGTAIRCHNASGLDISHDTFDDNVQYGLLFLHGKSDLKCERIHGNDLEFFGQVVMVDLQGDPSNRLANGYISLDGDFDYTGRGPAGTTNAGMIFQDVADIRVTGKSSNNLNHLIQLFNVVNANIGPLVSEGDGASLIEMPNGYSSTNVSVHDVTSNNPSVSVSGPALVSSYECRHCSFLNLTATKEGRPAFGTSNATVGVSLTGGRDIRVANNSFTGVSEGPYSLVGITPVSESESVASHIGSSLAASVGAIGGSGAKCAGEGDCTNSFGVITLSHGASSPGVVAHITFSSPYKHAACTVTPQTGTPNVFAVNVGITDVLIVSTSAVLPNSATLSYTCLGT